MSLGFTHKLPSISVFVLFAICIYYLPLSVPYMLISIVFAIWSGVSVAATILMELFYFRKGLISGELSQVTPLDFVYILILGGIVEDGLFETQVKFYHVIFGLAVWGLLIWSVETITQKYDNWRNWIKGKSTVLVEDGKVNVKELKKAKLEMEQLRTLMRMKGIFSLQEVEYAVLETSGMLSILPKRGEEPVQKSDMLEDYSKNVPTFLLIEEGAINDKALKRIGKSEDWLKKEMKSEGYDMNDVFFAEWNENSGFFIQSYQEMSGAS